MTKDAILAYKAYLATQNVNKENDESGSTNLS